jgi:hypothetical protein
MNFGGVKLFLFIVLLGFAGGTFIYFAFDFLLNPFITSPLLNMFSEPWFISGIIGSILLGTIVLIYAHFSNK